MMTDNELAEAYASKTLGAEEKQGVENRMQKDPPFAKLVNEYENTLEVLKRKWLRSNIQVAKKELWLRQLIKIGIITLAISSLLFIAGYQYLKSHKNKTKQTELLSSTKATVEMKVLLDTISKNDSLIGGVDLPIITPQKVQAFILNFKPSDIKPLTISFPLSLTAQDSFSAVPIENVFGAAYQVFNINPMVSNEIKCKNGTIINLPAHALVMSNGKEPQGNVNISVQEFSNYLEMYKHNIVTVSNGQLLETGGSCFIKAESNGDSVMLKKNQTYTIAFASKKDVRMKTFVGEKDSIGDVNWIEEKQTSLLDVATINTLSEQSAQIKDCDCNKKNYLFQTLVSDEGFYNSKTDEYTRNVLSKSNKVVELFDTFKSIVTPEIKTLYEIKSKLRLRFGVDSLGNLVRFDYNFRVNRKTEKALREAANYVVAKAHIELIDKGAKHVIINVDLMPTMTIQSKELAVIDTTAPIAVQNKAKQSNMNILVARSFGYINCDYFLNKANLLTKLVIKVPSDQTDVKVFFKSNKVVARCTVNGNLAVFTNAPENETILIVGTVMKNNKWTMALQEAKVGEVISLTDFKPFDLNKISAFLQLAP
ncbi:MAG: hypothetical protein PSX81_01420 [bacterium]|nr:hypothetical protein [bacterium]